MRQRRLGKGEKDEKMKTVEVKVPDMGDFRDVEVIELMVKEGETIAKDQSLVLVESDKASMEIPSPQSGKVKEMKVVLGDKVSEGSVLLLLETEDSGKSRPANAELSNEPKDSFPSNDMREEKRRSVDTKRGEGMADASDERSDAQKRGMPPCEDVNVIECDTVVLGAGPGGYTAAFRGADLGQKVVLVERYSVLGGVCLNVGCIPSKALLHAAKVITEAEEMQERGIRFGQPSIDLLQLNQWKQGVVDKLTGGLAALARLRKIEVVQGIGQFVSPNMMDVSGAGEKRRIRFKNAVIAAGSSAATLPGFPYGHPALVDSTGALQLKKIPEKMLIIGGGIIGLEMACVYEALGAGITIAEFSDGLIPAADRDVVLPLVDRISKRYDAVYTRTRVSALEENGKKLLATFEGAGAPKEPQLFDLVLVAVGRRPNGHSVGADKAGVFVDEHGFIPVNRRQQTNVPHIYAIGDICGEPMLAHKASYEGKVASEAISGLKTEYDATTVPSVAYTDPEVAWMGMTEGEARKRGIAIEKSVFPWNASGRALTLGRRDGLTKLIWDRKDHRLLGAAITGTNAGELLSETTLALEMGADLDDIALTIHPHPSLSETILFAAEIGLGTVTDLYVPRKK